MLIGILSAVAAESLALSFPIQCTLHDDCFVQNYVDLDSSPSARDYRCGHATYEGHKGTDIRVLSLSEADRGVVVVAAEAGRVKAARDGMQDRLITDDKHAIKDRECGNGVVIDHGHGFETQYCHLRRGSVRVKPGQVVSVNEPIGLLGYSGNTQFPHLHFAVRQDGRVVDPFSRDGSGDCDDDPEALWRDDVMKVADYQRGELIEMGFADGPVDLSNLERGTSANLPPTLESSAIVVYARFINLEEGDRLRTVLSGPSGEMADNTIEPLDSPKAQYMTFVGKRLRAEKWPSGSYRGLSLLIRSGRVVLDREIEIVLR